jgi:hypothetical protein
VLELGLRHHRRIRPLGFYLALPNILPIFQDPSSVALGCYHLIEKFGHSAVVLLPHRSRQHFATYNLIATTTS